MCLYHLLRVVVPAGEAKGAPSCCGLTARSSSLHCFKKNSIDNGEPATAGSSSDAQSAQRVTGGAGLLPCPDCGREFRGKAGVSQHRRRAHQEAYHKDLMPEQRKKARWVYEEKVLLARTEKNVVELGLNVTSKTMAEQFPSRSSESIKKMWQMAEYKRILESLSGVHATQDSPSGGSASSLEGANGTKDGRVEGGDSSKAHATFGATSMPSQVTQEQLRPGFPGPKRLTLPSSAGGRMP